MTDWFKARLLGRMRVSTIVLIVAFVALFWVNQTFQPEPPAPAPAVVPPGFVPDPAYTWVPRTNVRRPKEPTYTTTTTPPTTTTTTTSPTTTTPTTPTTSTTVVDPDGFGPLPPTTQTLTPSSSAPPAPGQLPLPTPTTTPAL
jgi:cytoskeletal protein RodZ